jgi:mono/diheme cytochrome c family protein
VLAFVTARLRLLPALIALVFLPGLLLADDPAESAGPAEGVHAEPAGPADGLDGASIWDGVYTEAQARRGESLYPGPCGKCHGVRLDGAPEDPDMFSTKPIAGRKFLRDWDGRTLGVLFEYLRTTMPSNNPGFLSDREYTDLIAFMLLRSGAPAGDAELQGDSRALAKLLISRDAPGD